MDFVPSSVLWEAYVWSLCVCVVCFTYLFIKFKFSDLLLSGYEFDGTQLRLKTFACTKRQILYDSTCMQYLE